MSRIYGIQEIVLGDVHPERIKAIKATTRNLGHDPKQLSTHLFPENPTHARARRIRENMLERVNDALVRWQGTMIIIPSMLALEHDMFRGVDDVCTRTGQKVRLIVATCRSSGSLRNALNADPELARFVGTYFHVHMTMADECLPKELEHLRSALKAQPSHSYPTISTWPSRKPIDLGTPLNIFPPLAVEGNYPLPVPLSSSINTSRVASTSPSAVWDS